MRQKTVRELCENASIIVDGSTRSETFGILWKSSCNSRASVRDGASGYGDDVQQHGLDIMEVLAKE